MRFSSREVLEILIAMAAMTLAFTMAQVGGAVGIEYVLRVGGPLAVGILALASFVAVITAFLLHELAHKAVAQRYGCWAEFRSYPMGLVLGVITGEVGGAFEAKRRAVAG